MSTLQSHEQLRSRLSARRAELASRYLRVATDLGHRDKPLQADSGEQAVQLQNDETLEVIGAAATAEIESIDEALQQLDRGLYGVCKQCDEAIPVERLRAIPYAVRCATCAASTPVKPDLEHAR